MRNEWRRRVACYTGVVRLRGFLVCCALMMGPGDPGYGGQGAHEPAVRKRWPQPALGESDPNETEVLFTFDDVPNPGRVELD